MFHDHRSRNKQKPAFIADNFTSLEQMEDQSSRDKSYITWTVEMDRTLTNLLLEEHCKDHKTPNGWKPVAFTAAINGMQAAHNLTFTKEKIIARLKTWNKYYKEVSAMLDTSGFGWDWDNNMVKVDSEEVWTNYVKAHPTTRHYRDKVIINWSDLGVICGADKATGNFAATPNESLNDIEIDSLAGESLVGASATVGGSTKERKRKAAPGDSIADAIRDMTVAIENAAAIITNSSKKQLVIDNDQIYAALARLDELTELEILKAMDLLGENKKKYKIFMALPDQMRIKWLRMQFYG